MIHHLAGKTVYKDDRCLTIDVSGVGYKVYVTTETVNLIAVGDSVSLWTHHAVRENSVDLYGFKDIKDLEFFEILLTVSGIGPKSALSIMNVASAESMQKAIISGDTTYLVKVSGIGKKTADKIVHELKDKIGTSEISDKFTVQGEIDAVEALKSLGYTQQEARDALKKIPKNLVITGERIKTALKILGRNHN